MDQLEFVVEHFQLARRYFLQLGICGLSVARSEWDVSQRPNQAADFFERVPSKHFDRQPQPIRLDRATLLAKS